MYSMRLTVIGCLFLSAFLVGCGPEPKKPVVVAPEEKAKLDAQHQAMSQAAKAGTAMPLPGAPAATPPTAAGHGR
jgi:hypothetical protein